MAEGTPNTVVEDAGLLRQLPFKRFEYVEVTFGPADTDQVIPYTILRPDTPGAIRWIDITPGTVYNGSSETVAHLYRSNEPDRLAWGDGYLVLRSTVAEYRTRLLLFVERA